MTLLAATEAKRLNTSDADMLADDYFQATRFLGYQIMHNPSTQSPNKYPFIVLYTNDVPEIWLETLQADGATLIFVPRLAIVETNAWLTGNNPRYARVYAKLHIWSMTHYDLIMFLDGDTILQHPMDGAFDEAIATLSDTDLSSATNTSDNESSLEISSLPPTYLFASISEAERPHTYPPTDSNGGFKIPGYFNAGFFLIKPNPVLLEYYHSIMSLPEPLYDPVYPEQNLLNYCHRQDGPMPAKWVGPTWNIRWPTDEDWQAGVASAHEKWWRIRAPVMREYVERQRAMMEGFYLAMGRGREGAFG